MNDELKTPSEWEALTGVLIQDADGWNGSDGRSFDDPIDYAEWVRRSTISTTYMRTLKS